jgi:hypothetical protein
MQSSPCGRAGKLFPRFGTIKSQGPLDGKFRVNMAVRPLEYREFPQIRVAMASFRGDPESQSKRYQRHRSDAAEPERGEPQQTLRERALRRLDLHQ